MTTYKVKCYIPGQSITTTIEAREVTVREGAYLFWKGENDQAKFIASYPVAFTVVEIEEEKEEEKEEE